MTRVDLVDLWRSVGLSVILALVARGASGAAVRSQRSSSSQGLAVSVQQSQVSFLPVGTGLRPQCRPVQLAVVSGLRSDAVVSMFEAFVARTGFMCYVFRATARCSMQYMCVHAS